MVRLVIRNLEWREESADDQRVMCEGRELQILKQTTGTYALVVWKLDPRRSAVVGVYHHPAVAKFAAETTPLDDASLARLSKNHTAFIGETAEAVRK